jgi:hypothetical protein
MDDNYIHFELDSRKLKINKENPDDILMLKTHGGGYKLKKPRWNQIKVYTRKSDGYRVIQIKPKKYKLHRINYYAHNQDWDIHDSSSNNQIDHEDDKDNLPKHQYNNIENLRVVTNQENQWNTKAKGYYWDKRRQKWRAQIMVSGKKKHLGDFVLEEEAHQAYLEAKKIYHNIK